MKSIYCKFMSYSYAYSWIIEPDIFVDSVLHGTPYSLAAGVFNLPFCKLQKNLQFCRYWFSFDSYCVFCVMTEYHLYLTLELTSDNCCYVHSLKLIRCVALKNHYITNHYPRNINKTSLFCRKGPLYHIINK